MTIQHLRSSTANKRPTPAAMSDGQLAVNTNTASPGLFFKDSAGALIKVGPVHVGTTAPNASPASGGETGNTVGEQWLDTTGGTYVFKVWDGSAWRSETGTFVDVNGDVMTGAFGIIAGSAGSPGLYFSGDTNTGLYSPGADQVAISTGGSRRFSIDSGGTVLVGSGAVNPAGVGAGPTLSITGDAPEITLRDSATGNPYAWMATNDFGSLILAADHGNNAASSIIDFRVDGTERMRIDSSGRVGIGTTGPNRQLEVSGGGDTFIRVNATSGAVKSGIELSYGGTTYAQLYYNNVSPYDVSLLTTSTSSLIFGTNNTERARIDTSGRLLVGTSTGRSIDGINAALQVEGTTTAASSINLTRNADSPSSAFLQFAKSRGSSNGSSTIVRNSDGLGWIQFAGADGTDIETCAASIAAFVDGTPGANDMPGRIVLSTTADGASSPTERMRIGQLGYLKASNNGTYFDSTSPYHERNNNVADWIAVDRNSNANPYGILFEFDSDPNNTANQFWRCRGGGVTRAEIRSNGGLANYSGNNVNLSDINAKKNISPAAGTWDCIKEWEIVNYRYKDQPDDADLNLGVIAQQVAESCPEVITVFSEATEDEPEKLGVKEQQMYWMAIKALQEAQVRIEQLEATNADLLARVSALESA